MHTLSRPGPSPQLSTAPTAMNTVRKIIIGSFYFIGSWVIASFVGVMFNPSNAGLWTTSLMWSLLASLLVMPGLVLVYHASQARHQKERKVSRDVERPPFVEDEHEEGTLWPMPEEDSSVQR